MLHIILILSLLSYQIASVGSRESAVSTALRENLLKKVQFCNPIDEELPVYVEVNYRSLLYAMEVAIIDEESCETIEAVIGANYFSNTPGAIASYKIMPNLNHYIFGDASTTVFPMIEDDDDDDDSYGSQGNYTFDMMQRVNSLQQLKKRLVTAEEKDSKTRVKVLNFAGKITLFEQILTIHSANYQLKRSFDVSYGEEAYLNAGIGSIMYALDTNKLNDPYTDPLPFSTLTKTNSKLSTFAISKIERLWVIIDPNHPPSADISAYIQARKQHAAEYLQSHGIPWLHYYGKYGIGPRKPPLLHMWEAKEVGQMHRVVSKERYWQCNPNGQAAGESEEGEEEEEDDSEDDEGGGMVLGDEGCHEESRMSMINHNLLLAAQTTTDDEEDEDSSSTLTTATATATATTNTTGPITLTLEVVSTHPKVFLIRNFLSIIECQEIIRLAEPNLKPSMIVQSKTSKISMSDIRSSSTAWVNRRASLIMDSIYRRAADVLQVEEGKLHFHINAEDLQVVKYTQGQYYRNHHDAGEHGQPNSRYATLLMYLTNQSSPNAGGETAFPMAENEQGFKIHPGQGSAILFYSLLEDGNMDDLAVHTALPVNEGVKWLGNLWIWDPLFKGE